MLTTTHPRCSCFQVIQPQNPHQCQLCQRKISACLYSNDLQHKITLQAIEINQLNKELRNYELEIRNQQLNLQAVNTKYLATMETMTEIKLQKEQADHELEELSTRLFEEANNMVASERKKSVHLENLLCMSEDQLLNERSQLQELKHRMAALGSLEDIRPKNTTARVEYIANQRDWIPTSGIHSNSLLVPIHKETKRRNTVDSASVPPLFSATSAPATPGIQDDRQDLTNGVQMLSLLDDESATPFDINSAQFKVFYSYLAQYSNRGSSSGKTSNRSSSYFDSSDEDEMTSNILSLESHPPSFLYYDQHQQPPQLPAQQCEYVVQCEKEDIEPCLSFSNPESRMCVKTMMEYMLHKPCFIEYISLDVAKTMPTPLNAISSAYYRPLWERWTASSPYGVSPSSSCLECAACGKKTWITQQAKAQVLKFYRFRLVEEDDWLLIDHSCRNRLVAVCDFYSFLRNIRLGLYQNRTLADLFTENIRLRLKVFYSR